MATRSVRTACRRCWIEQRDGPSPRCYKQQSCGRTRLLHTSVTSDGRAAFPLSSSFTAQSTTALFLRKSPPPRTKGILDAAARSRTTRGFSTSVYAASGSSMERAIAPREEWELYNLSAQRRRSILINPDAATRWVDALELDKMQRPATIIELYAGTGVLTEALLKHPKVDKVIAVECVDRYLPKLQKVIDRHSDRAVLVEHDPFWWDTYSIIKKRGHLDDLVRVPWGATSEVSAASDETSESEKSELVLVGMIPWSIHGERLVIQQLACIAGQLWLYDYGPFKSHYLLSKDFGSRLVAAPGEKNRHKLAVTTQMLTTPKISLDEKAFKPEDENFELMRKRSSLNRRKPQQWVLASFSPSPSAHALSPEDYETLEYLARNLFVHKQTAWYDALRFLAPGAQRIADMAEGDGRKIDRTLVPWKLDGADWLALVRAFNKWPFRPRTFEQTEIVDAQLEREGKL